MGKPSGWLEVAVPIGRRRTGQEQLSQSEAAAPGGSFKVIFRHHRLSSFCPVVKVFIQADSQEGAGYIPQILIAMPLETADRVIAALSRPAVDVDRDIPGNLLYPLPELA